MCRFPSSRDPGHGVNVAVVSPAVFGRNVPHAFQNWHCSATNHSIEMTRRDMVARQSIVFERDVFLVHKQLPMPALERVTRRTTGRPGTA